MKIKVWLWPSIIVFVVCMVLISTFEFIPSINNFILATLLISYVLGSITLVVMIFKSEKRHKVFSYIYSIAVGLFFLYMFFWTMIISLTAFSQPEKLEYNGEIYYYEISGFPSDIYTVSVKTGPITRKTIFNDTIESFENPDDALLNEANTKKIIDKYLKNN